MGDNSPKNQHKLVEQKHDEHIKKDHQKHENAERQHHPDVPTPEEVTALKKSEEGEASAENAAN